MPVFGNMRMAASAGLACGIDPFLASRTYLFRGYGNSGTQPTMADAGAVTWHYRDVTKAALSTTASYWPTQYGSSMFFNGNGIICDPTQGDVNTPFQTFGRRDDSWSHMMRVIVAYSEGTVTLRSIGTAGLSWETNDLMYDLYVTYDVATGKRRIVVSFSDGTGGQGANGTGWGVRSITSTTLYPQATPMEILVTRDASTRNTYLFVNGNYEGIWAGGQLRNAADATALKIATAGTPNTGTNGNSGSQATFYLNDDIVWSACIATSAYTPMIMPFC